MSFTQRLVLRFAGKRAPEIEAESRSWVAICGSCGHQTSYWDLGGVRYGASSSGKKIRITCPSCGAKGWSDVTRIPSA